MLSDLHPQALREKTCGPEALSKRSRRAEPFIDRGVGSGQDRVLGQVVLNLDLSDPQPPRLISAAGWHRGKRTGVIWKQGTCHLLEEVKVEGAKTER